MKTIPQLTKNNHFVYWYDDKPFSFRTHERQLFKTTHAPVQRHPKDWRWECINCAKEVREHYSGQISVLFSGGMDSEVVVRSFAAAGIDINVVIMEYEGGLNSHDTEYAHLTCQDLGIKPQILRLDLLKFWEQDIFKYSDPVKVVSPQLATIIWGIDQIDGTVVLGAGEGFVRRPEGKNTFYEMESEIAYSLYRWFVHTHREGVPAFFQFNSEVMLSFMLDKNVLAFIRDAKKRRLLSTSKVKHELYSKHFDLRFREPLNGFEKVKEQDLELRNEMQKRYPGANSVYKVNHHKYINSFGLKIDDEVDSYFKNFESRVD